MIQRHSHTHHDWFFPRRFAIMNHHTVYHNHAMPSSIPEPFEHFAYKPSRVETLQLPPSAAEAVYRPVRRTAYPRRWSMAGV